MKEIDIIKNWRFRSDRVQHAYYIAGRRYEKFHKYLGFIAVLLMTTVGTVAFYKISNTTETHAIFGDSTEIITGGISVLAAVLTALQTFYKFAELGEKHRVAGARFAHLKHKLELLEAAYQNQELAKELSSIESEWAKLREDSPHIPDSIWNKVNKELTYAKHRNKYIRSK